jgi:hypothetical protein
MSQFAIIQVCENKNLNEFIEANMLAMTEKLKEEGMMPVLLVCVKAEMTGGGELRVKHLKNGGRMSSMPSNIFHSMKEEIISGLVLTYMV